MERPGNTLAGRHALREHRSFGTNGVFRRLAKKKIRSRYTRVATR